jgi:4-hydroxy-3-polyprenylbenzoate decarboxylase
MRILQRPWVVAITGASGAIYGVRLVRELIRSNVPIHLIITDAGWRVMQEELEWPEGDRMTAFKRVTGADDPKASVVIHPLKDIGASIASGSYLTVGMVVVPCSMGTLANISSGSSRNLLERTADVMLKEGRSLILVPRESPFNMIHLENMLKLSRMGVAIVPAMPAFYHQPKSIDDLIDFQVGKLMDRMGIDNRLFRRWGMNADGETEHGLGSDRPN